MVFLNERAGTRTKRLQKQRMTSSKAGSTWLNASENFWPLDGATSGEASTISPKVTEVIQYFCLSKGEEICIE